VQSNYTDGLLTLNYVLDGVTYVPITYADVSLVLVLLDRDTASLWSAPIISGSGIWSNYFGVGTNMT
jgi:hypothetical protein